MTPTELFDAFRLEVDDTAAPFLWSEDEIYTYMDKSQRAFARATDCFLDATTPAITQIAIIADQALVALSPLVIKPRRAELASTFRRVEITTLAALDEGAIVGRDYARDYGLSTPWRWRSATGEPLFAITDFQPGKLLLVPQPVTADTLSLVVYRMPLNKITSASATFEVTDEDHQYGLRLYMQHRAYLKQDSETYNPKRSQTAKAEWLEFIDAANGSFRRQRFTPKAVMYGGI